MRVLMTLFHTSNGRLNMKKTQDVLEGLRDIYRHETCNGTDTKRDSGWKLLSRACGGLNELLESGIRREANSRIGALSHHLDEMQVVEGTGKRSGRTTGNRPRYMPAIPSCRTMDVVPCTRPRYWGFGRLASSMSFVLERGCWRERRTEREYALDRFGRGDSDDGLHHPRAQASWLPHDESRGQMNGPALTEEAFWRADFALWGVRRRRAERGRPTSESAKMLLKWS